MNRETSAKPIVKYEIFESLDIRVGKIISANLAEGMRNPSRLLRIDLGPYGEALSVGQFAMVPECDLIGKNVICCCNFGPRKMGRYISEVLVLGTAHSESPLGQHQAWPILANIAATPGDFLF